MNLTLSSNMIYYVVVIVFFGKAIKPLIKKNRKSILPIILMIFGAMLAFIVGKLNGNIETGNSILQGVISSLVAQYGFDKIKDIANKGVNDVWET